MISNWDIKIKIWSVAAIYNLVHTHIHTRFLSFLSSEGIQFTNNSLLFWTGSRSDQFGTASSPPSIHLCQLTTIKLPQDTSTQSSRCGHNSSWAARKRAGQGGGQNAEWWWWPGASHFHTPQCHCCYHCYQAPGQSGWEQQWWVVERRWQLRASHFSHTLWPS